VIVATILDLVNPDDRSPYPARAATANLTLMKWADVDKALAALDRTRGRYVTITDGRRTENWMLAENHWKRISQTWIGGTL
jgi:hypothetical protein